MVVFKTATSEDIGKLLIRIAIGGILLFHGAFKLVHGVEWIKQPLGQLGLPGFLAYGVYIGEVLAPILIIIGFITRPAALAIAIDILMAIVLVQRDRIFTINSMSGGWAIELEVLILLGALAIVFIGAGKYAVTKRRSIWN